MRALLRDAQDQTRIALEVEECPDSNATINDKRDTFLRVSLFLLVGQVGIEPRCFSCHGFTDRCASQLRVLTHMAESAELESDTMRCNPLSGRSPDLLGSLFKYGWGGWIRTNKCRCQRPVP
jgi:hypothetical protein